MKRYIPSDAERANILTLVAEFPADHQYALLVRENLNQINGGHWVDKSHMDYDLAVLRQELDAMRKPKRKNRRR